jgi:methylmalonyl-CoA mutase C-terminal domain/subunit
VSAALQEDVDAIGLSILSGAHNVLIPKIMSLLKEKKADDIPVIAGGIIPDKDVPGLKSHGIAAVFTPGASTRDIIGWVDSHIRNRKGFPQEIA